MFSPVIESKLATTLKEGKLSKFKEIAREQHINGYFKSAHLDWREQEKPEIQNTLKALFHQLDA